MEWVRSAYASSWRLFKDSDLETTGRYVFTPKGIPCYPSPHHYGSSEWTTDDDVDRSLGEVGPRKWSNGIGPRPFPIARFIGSKDCIAEGEVPPVMQEPPCNADFGIWEGNYVGPPFPSGAVMRSELFFQGEPITEIDGQVYTPKITWPEGSNDPNDLLCVLECNGNTAAAPLAAPIDCSFFVPGNFITFRTAVSPFPPPSTQFLPFDLRFHIGNAAIISPSDCIGGFPVKCYPKNTRQVVSLPAKPDPFSDFDALELAKILSTLGSDATAAKAMLALWLNAPSTIDAVDNTATGVVPGSLIGQTTHLNIVMVTGTSNPFQAATQVLYEAVPAVDYTAYSTNGIWHFAALAILDRIANAGINPLLPITFVGHSYGGAICCIHAAEFARANAGRLVNLLTFGCPKPGDHRLRTLLQATRHRHLVNLGDPVPGLPFSSEEYEPLLLLFPILRLGQMTSFVRPLKQFLIDDNGVQTESDAEPLALLDLLSIIADVLAVDPIPPFEAHTMVEYVRRLSINPHPR